MAFDRPTLNQIRTRIQNDIEAELPGSDARLRRRAEYAFSVALAGASHNAHGRISFHADQILPDTAVAEFLDRWAAIWLGANARAQPTKASGVCRFEGTDTTVVPAGTKIERPSNGQVYSTLAAQTVGEEISGAVLLEVEADEAGADGNAAASTQVRLQSAIAGVESDGFVRATEAFSTEGLTGGTDLETDASLLERVLARIQDGPDIEQPGTFERRARDTGQATRAWEIPNLNGALTVLLFFVDDNDPSGIIPGPTKIAAVDTAVQAASSIWADVQADAPVAVPLDLTIQLTPDTTEVREAVIRELEDLLLREATAKGGTITVQSIREAIGRAPGEDFHNLISPTADQAYGIGLLAVLGTITWS